MASDFLTSLKTLLQQVQEKEKSPSDLVRNLNSWAREIGELIKSKVEEEVESSVKKMGFVEKRDLAALEARIARLENMQRRLKKKAVKSATKKSSARSSTKAKGPKKGVKR